MASTARNKEETREFFDEPDVLEEKIDQLVEMVRDSRHFIAFTGAGISTSAGIPDFRSGMNTILNTGPGAWELQAHKASRDHRKHRTVSTLQAIPTATHMSLVALEKEGRLKFLISQNCDGLHRRSGFNPEHLAELHGNTNLEKCTECGRGYLRDFSVRNHRNHVHDHLTGRHCFHCQKEGRTSEPTLIDSIINFGENLPERELTEGFRHAERADLCLVLGSSCTVSPACDMPHRVGERHKNLVIVNLQNTPLEREASLHIYATCDVVMAKLMERLALPIPEWRLRRFVKLRHSPLLARASNAEESKFNVSIETYEQEDCETPFQCISSLQFGRLEEEGLQVKESSSSSREGKNNPVKRLNGGFTLQVPFLGAFPPSSRSQEPSSGFLASSLRSLSFTSSEGKRREESEEEEEAGRKEREVEVELAFMGHYNEPVVSLPFHVVNDGSEHEEIFSITINPMEEEGWEVSSLL